MRTINLILLVAAVMLVTAAAAHASAKNTIQPANVYFGRVVSGQHPERVVTVSNHTGRAVMIRRYSLAGSGGGKFTLVRHDGRVTATCALGEVLRNGASCTLILRVKTTTPEWWQSVLMVSYGAPETNIGPFAGQWNGAVYAHVV